MRDGNNVTFPNCLNSGMFKSRILFCSLFFLLFSISCRTQYISKSIEYKDYKISKAIGTNQKLNTLIAPYADSVHKSMNDVIATSAMDMDKKLPENLLGNLMSDILFLKAKEKYVTNVDGSIMNYGGIRLPVLTSGDITRGKVFELSPFDNIIVLQILDGKILQMLLDHIASKGGWPVSGITFQIKNKKAINVTVGNQPISENKKYTIALLDYVANGGDDANMLRGITPINHGFLFRDAILEYMIQSNKSGIPISSKLEKRISNAD